LDPSLAATMPFHGTVVGAEINFADDDYGLFSG
jgi:hypothetical protein